MDDFIIPGQPKKKGGVRTVVDVPGSSAPTVKLGPDDVLRVGDIGLRFLTPGVYIILPLELWSRTLARSIARAQATLDADMEIHD
jgi:hypothetical protein